MPRKIARFIRNHVASQRDPAVYIVNKGFYVVAKSSKFVYDGIVGKILTQLILPAFLVFICASTANIAYSQNSVNFCDPNSLPNKVTVNLNSKDATVEIKVPNPENSRFWIWAGDTKANGTISQNGYVIFNLGKLPPGNYKFDLFIDGSSLRCSSFIAIPDQGQGGIISSTDNIKFSPPNPTINDIITATVSGLPLDGEYYTLSLYNPYTPFDQSAEQPIQCAESKDKKVSFTIQPITTGGIRNVSVYRKDPQRTNECRSLNEMIADGQIAISSPIILPTISPPPCIEFKDGQCVSVKTAIGTISTDPPAFVKFIFSVVLGLAGGISLILIIISGYRIMASSGNPEALAAGRQQLISAIVGLLFIIFSFVILEVIGVDILRIPGFEP